MKNNIKSIGIFAHTNDYPTLETGVTQYNLDLLDKLCNIFSDWIFYVYVSPENSKRYKGLNYPNARIIILPLIDILENVKTNILLRLFDLVGQYLGISQKKYTSYGMLLNQPIHQYYMYTVFGLFQDFPVFVKSKLKVPCISAIHDIRFLLKENEVKGVKGVIKQLKNSMRFSAILNSSDLLLVPTSFSRNVIQAKYGKQNIAISYSVPDLTELNATDDLTNEEVKIVESLSKRYLYYPSTIVDIKNHDTLIDAMAILKSEYPDLQLVLVGSNWNSKLGLSLQEKIRKLHLGENVIHLGFISFQFKVYLMRNAICLTVPSNKESFNLTIWEAFAVGCPVICSDDPELKEQVDNAALISILKSPVSLASKIKNMLEDGDTRLRLSQLGLERYNTLKANSLLSGWEKIFEND